MDPTARSVLGMGAAFALVMPFAVWLARPFQAARPTELPQDPTDPAGAVSLVVGALVFVGLAIAMAAFVIWAVRTGRQKIIQGMVLTSVAVALLVVLARPAMWLIPWLGADLPWLLALLLAGGMAVLLGIRPSWPLINSAAFLVAAGVAALAGAVLGVTPLLLLLAFIAVYDHIAVRRTKHMMALARAATDLRLPIAMQFGGPPIRRRGAGQAAAAGTGADPARPAPAAPSKAHPAGPRRTQILMGIGDLVFPTALVVAAADPASTWSWGPPVAAGFGVLVAFGVLVREALKGDPQPGLPLLNAGAIVGFLAGLALETRSLVFW